MRPTRYTLSVPALVGIFLFLPAAIHGGEHPDLGDKKTPHESPSSGYNEPWPKGRGFKPGQTVPDIPLYDMRGKEVRLSQFLGKQYILYCWASW